MFFIDLPDHVLAEIFAKWISLDQVAKLDISITNDSFRQNFLSIVREISFNYEEEDYYCGPKCICSWLNARSIQLESLCVKDSTLVDGNILYNLKLCRKVKSIKLRTNLTVGMLVALINSVEKLHSLDGFHGDLQFTDVAPLIQSSIIVSLSYIGGVYTQDIETITKYCPNLNSIRLCNVKGLYIALPKLIQKCPKLNSIELWQSFYQHKHEEIPFIALLAREIPQLSYFKMPSISAETKKHLDLITKFYANKLHFISHHNYCAQSYDNVHGIKTVTYTCHNLGESMKRFITDNVTVLSPLLTALEFTAKCSLNFDNFGILHQHIVDCLIMLPLVTCIGLNKTKLTPSTIMRRLNRVDANRRVDFYVDGKKWHV